MTQQYINSEIIQRENNIVSSEKSEPNPSYYQYYNLWFHADLDAKEKHTMLKCLSSCGKPQSSRLDWVF